MHAAHVSRLASRLLLSKDPSRWRWRSVRRGLENAGATWVDRAFVEDENLIASRSPSDLDAFCHAREARLVVPHLRAARGIRIRGDPSVWEGSL